MTRREFRKTIEYKERMREIKLLASVFALINVIFDGIAVAAYFYFVNLDPSVAIGVLASIACFALLPSSPAAVAICYLARKLTSIRKATDSMHVFEYKLGLPDERRLLQSRYLVRLDYGGSEYGLMTAWVYASSSLDNKKVSMGFIKEANTVVLLALA